MSISNSNTKSNQSNNINIKRTICMLYSIRGGQIVLVERGGCRLNLRARLGFWIILLFHVHGATVI